MPTNVTEEIREELAEQGLKPPLPPVSDMMPPQDGQYAIRHHLMFSGLVNQMSRTYRWSFDEALRECPTNAKAMRRDPVIMGALRSRQMPTAQLDFHLEAQDESDPAQLECVALLEDVIKKNFPNWQGFKMWLLEAIWWGKVACEMTMEWKIIKGKRCLCVKDWRPVMGDKLVFKWSGQVGCLVYPGFDIQTESTERGRAHFLTPAERQCWVVHHFEVEDADFFDFEMAGGVMGYGVRGRLYWYWFLKTKTLSQLSDYLQRVALGWTIYWYEDGNDESMARVALAAERHVNGQAILMPRKKEGEGPGITRLEPSGTGADLFRSMVTEYFDDVIEQYIKGEMLTTGVGGTGMGSGVAEAHQATKEGVVTYDAVGLGETLTKDLLTTLCRWTFGPEMPVPKLVFDVEKPNVDEYMNGVQAFFEMGGQIDADDARSVLGIPRPEPGHEILAKVAPEQPATIGSPQGVPVQSEGQPDPNQPQMQDLSQQGQPMQGQQGPPQFADGPMPAVVQRQRAKDSNLLPSVQKRNRWKETLTKIANNRRRMMRGKVGTNGVNDHHLKADGLNLY